MKKYNVETVYALEGQIFKSYFEEATHATIFRGSIRETVEIESLVKNKVSVAYYYSFISDYGKYDILGEQKVISVKFY